MSKANPPFMNGVPELLVLRLLARREMYGYELVKAVRTATNEAIGLREGIIYPTLYALEKRGSLKARRRTVDKRSRVYYAITAKGRHRLEALTEDWRRVTGGIRTALGETARA
jgi:PadR family transcriptional regulator PadR